MRSFIAGALCALFAVSCFAETVVVTAARIPQSSDELVRPVTVVTSEDIARSGQQSLVDILQALGAVEVSRNGGYGQLSSVFIRGANSNHTLVLVDGLRVSSVTSGATAFENLPVNQIERIEIVPGPASGLYGSDAIGGVVQIFTKGGAASPLTAAAGFGTYGTRSVAVGAAGALGDATVSVNTGYFSTRGFSATKPTIPFAQFNADDDGYRNANVSAKLARRFGADHELGLTLFHSEGRTWFDSGAASDDVSDERLQAFSIYSRNRLTESWESLLRAGEGRDDLSIRGAFPSSFDTRQPQLAWQNTLGVPLGTAIAGVEHLRQRLETTRAFAKKSRDVTSYFAGYSGSHQAYGWQFNVRRDDNDQYGGHSTGNAAFGYGITAAWRLRLGAGRAFKAPTFNDLYFPGFSNPDLRPERSRNAEAGFDWRAAGHSLHATHFDNRVTDLIVFDSATSKPQNISRARITGTELAYGYDAGALHAGARATFQHPRNEDTGRSLQRRARRHGAANARYTLAGWTFGGELVASSARFDSAGESPATRLHGYALLNLTAARALAGGWTVRLRWDNVTNREYEIAQHYNTPGSSVFVAVDYAK